MLDILLEEMQAKINELHKLKERSERAAVTLDPKYSISEMRSALLAMTFTKAAVEAAKKKIELAG